MPQFDKVVPLNDPRQDTSVPWDGGRRHLPQGAVLPSATNAASLFDAYDLIRNAVSPSAASLFDVTLLFSGQSSFLIATQHVP
ncbi:uncharacterized protein ARMOST_14577 [Armillaria ostoyae]|uniref:Uncharacterized protein n=1 Tax=Armillaria ostoyae TaxID=47428 RepID=A0A284RR04_ARMOS|nr:uncharacterized protein ARMOST_14577 [Armillaria ostoyae]